MLKFVYNMSNRLILEL